ncbi:MAG: methyltransferase domain-containing protein [Balneolaceae bacterium]|nr:methyltransferase domain-containing protein [Balneolaceae bacterium]
MEGFLAHRQQDLIEWMEKEDCDPEKLHRTYQQFKTINRLLSGWKRIYKSRIRPKLEREQINTMLDIGFGGGDIPIAITKWANRDGFDLEILAIELDDRALEFAQQLDAPKSITFEKKHAKELIAEDCRFDFVISNHVLHHLSDEEIPVLLNESDELAKKSVIFNDIERNAVGYTLFASITPLLFRDSFITVDGLISIKRSFKSEELERIIPKKWKIDQMPLFRILLTLDKS